MLEYQKGEDELRFRVVEAPAIVVYEEMRRTLIDLGLPIVRESFAGGVLVAENNAPSPLTKKEWLNGLSLSNTTFRKTTRKVAQAELHSE